jgi:WD40 repeat protein
VRVELLNRDKSHLINAHDGNINAIALNMDGSRLATASEKGTLIRVFNTYTGEKVQEVRRGAEKAYIYSISFSPDSKFFCCSSDKGTIHIFVNKSGTGPESTKENGEVMEKEETGNVAGSISNRKSKISFFGGYFSSEWSHSKYRGPECPSAVCFGYDNQSVIVFTADGTYLKLSFDAKKGGDCIRKAYSRFSRIKN